MQKSKYEVLGLIDRPFSLTGVPPIRKRYVPIGFEKELNQLINALEVFLRGSENILVILIGEYGFGKTELLDYFEDIVKSKYGLDTLRLSLTFGLDTSTIISTIIKNRKLGKPLVLLIDEADEISRLAALTNLVNVADTLKQLVVNVGTVIRAILEPRNYAQVLNVNPQD